MNIPLDKIIIIILLVISLKAKAQYDNSFYFDVNKAYEFALVGKYDSSIIVYERNFKKINFIQTKYLQVVIKLANKTNNESLRTKYENILEKQKQATDPKIKKIIDSLITLDQSSRKDLKNIRASRFLYKCKSNNEYDKNRPRYLRAKKRVDCWRKQDEAVIEKLIDLFKVYGFIGEELVGFERYLNIFAMLLHFDTDTNNKVLLPILLKAIDDGKIWPIHAAQIIDRHTEGGIHKQTYWTYIGESDKKFTFTESDIPAIIKKRESLGIYGSKIEQIQRNGKWVLKLSSHK